MDLSVAVVPTEGRTVRNTYPSIFWWQVELEERATTTIWEFEILAGKPSGKATELQLQWNFETRVCFDGLLVSENDRATTTIWELELFWQVKLEGDRATTDREGFRWQNYWKDNWSYNCNRNLGTWALGQLEGDYTTGEDRTEGASFWHAFLTPFWGPKTIFFFKRNDAEAYVWPKSDTRQTQKKLRSNLTQHKLTFGKNCPKHKRVWSQTSHNKTKTYKIN